MDTSGLNYVLATGLIVGGATIVAAIIADQLIPQAWIKIDKYHKFIDGNLKLMGQERMAFYKVSNYTGHIKTVYKGPYQIR